MVTLIVWFSNDKGGRKLEVEVGSHQEASRMARTKFSGMKTKVLNKGARDWGTDMHSACDQFAGWVA